MSDRATLKKAGYKFVDKPDSDIREHNNDILDYLAAQSPAVKAARRESIKRNIDKYADATIADLGLANTKQTKDFVKEYLTTSSTYVYSVLNDK